MEGILFTDFIERLKQNYKKGLPGRKGQLMMKPYVGPEKSIFMPPSKNARKGAVLALLYPKNEIVHLALIQRASYDGVHGGQISFPGGKIEEDDKSPLAAALRETEEEVGIDTSDIEVLGPITEVFVLASNFLVYPFLSYIENEPIFVIDTYEVDDMIEIPFHYFLQPEKRSEKKIKSKAGFYLNAPFFDVSETELWGATAMMIAEIVAIYDNAASSSNSTSG